MSIVETIVSTWNGFWVAIIALVEKIFTSLWTMLKDLFFWVLDQIMGLAVGLLGEVDLSAITQNFGVFNQIPEDILNILGLIGFAQCMIIIGGAIGIRMLLQLIPFVRLGS